MSSKFLEAAERLGARLCRDALWSNGHCNWTADFASGNDVIGHRALLPDLYDGVSGIALFLHRLAVATGDRIFGLTAQAALRQACSKLPLAKCGLYTGGAGVLYAQLRIRDGECDPDELLQQTASLNPNELDVISGGAGIVAMLLAAYRNSSQQALLDRAFEHGELLLSQAVQTDAGLSWRLAGTDTTLTGFSHGAAGFGWALLELQNETGDARFRQAALQAFAFERAHFDSERRNWPDFRQRPPGFMNAWCHGAPGIALSRVRAWELLGDEVLRSEAEVALETTAAKLPSAASSDYSLCHGIAGNADILVYASIKLNRPEYLEIAKQAALEALDRFEHRRLPWPCGISNANELPDLMLGIAGIGHLYLRVHDPSLQTPLLPL